MSSTKQTPLTRHYLCDLASSQEIFALAGVHFTWNWYYYSLLAWMPNFLATGLGFNLANASFISLLPYAATVAMTTVVGVVADKLVADGTMSISGE